MRIRKVLTIAGVVAFWAWFCVALTMSLVLSAQGAEEKAKVSLELTEVETLQISIVMKDLVIANLQIQNLQAQFQTLVARRGAQQANFNAIVERLRTVHEAPADKFTFDSATLKFVPIPPPVEEK